MDIKCMTGIMLAAMITDGNLVTADVASQTNVVEQVLDHRREPLSFVNVILLNARDSTYIQGLTTDENGGFSISPENVGLLKISGMGDKMKFVSVSGDSVVMPDEDVMALGEVTATAHQASTGACKEAMARMNK